MKHLKATKCKRCGSDPIINDCYNMYEQKGYICYCKPCWFGRPDHGFKTIDQAIEYWNSVNKKPNTKVIN